MTLTRLLILWIALLLGMTHSYANDIICRDGQHSTAPLPSEDSGILNDLIENVDGCGRAALTESTLRYSDGRYEVYQGNTLFCQTMGRDLFSSNHNHPTSAMLCQQQNYTEDSQKAFKDVCTNYFATYHLNESNDQKMHMKRYLDQLRTFSSEYQAIETRQMNSLSSTALLPTASESTREEHFACLPSKRKEYFSCASTSEDLKKYVLEEFCPTAYRSRGAPKADIDLCRSFSDIEEIEGALTHNDRFAHNYEKRNEDMRNELGAVISTVVNDNYLNNTQRLEDGVNHQLHQNFFTAYIENKFDLGDENLAEENKALFNRLLEQKKNARPGQAHFYVAEGSFDEFSFPDEYTEAQKITIKTNLVNYINNYREFEENVQDGLAALKAIHEIRQGDNTALMNNEIGSLNTILKGTEYDPSSVENRQKLINNIINIGNSFQVHSRVTRAVPLHAKEIDLRIFSFLNLKSLEASKQNCEKLEEKTENFCASISKKDIVLSEDEQARCVDFLVSPNESARFKNFINENSELNANDFAHLLGQACYLNISINRPNILEEFIGHTAPDTSPSDTTSSPGSNPLIDNKKTKGPTSIAGLEGTKSEDEEILQMVNGAFEDRYHDGGNDNSKGPFIANSAPGPFNLSNATKHAIHKDINEQSNSGGAGSAEAVSGDFVDSSFALTGGNFQNSQNVELENNHLIDQRIGSPAEAGAVATATQTTTRTTTPTRRSGRNFAELRNSIDSLQDEVRSGRTEEGGTQDLLELQNKLRNQNDKIALLQEQLEERRNRDITPDQAPSQVAANTGPRKPSGNIRGRFSPSSRKTQTDGDLEAAPSSPQAAAAAPVSVENNIRVRLPGSTPTRDEASGPGAGTVGTATKAATNSLLVSSAGAEAGEAYVLMNFDEIEEAIVVSVNSSSLEVNKPVYTEVEKGVYQEFVLLESGEVLQRRILVKEMISELSDEYQNIVRDITRVRQFDDLEL